jgi:hypothetical protein
MVIYLAGLHYQLKELIQIAYCCDQVASFEVWRRGCRRAGSSEKQRVGSSGMKRCGGQLVSSRSRSKKTVDPKIVFGVI